MRVLGASFSRFGCFVLWSSFSSASFSKLPWNMCENLDYESEGGKFQRATKRARILLKDNIQSGAAVVSFSFFDFIFIFRFYFLFFS